MMLMSARPTMVTLDPRPNQHKWCGILRSYESENELVANQDYVYFKANSDSHFISQGTVIKKILIWECDEIPRLINLVLDEIEKNVSVIRLETSYDRQLLLESMNDHIRDCQIEVGDKSKIIVITGIDEGTLSDQTSHVSTSPLCLLINAFVERQFNDEKWLTENSSRVGADNIRLGRSLPRFPFPGK